MLRESVIVQQPVKHDDSMIKNRSVYDKDYEEIVTTHVLDVNRIENSLETKQSHVITTTHIYVHI